MKNLNTQRVFFPNQSEGDSYARLKSSYVISDFG